MLCINNKFRFVDNPIYTNSQENKLEKIINICTKVAIYFLNVSAFKINQKSKN